MGEQQGRGRGTSISSAQIETAIYLVRGQRVLMAADLAEMYGVTVSQLNQSVKRNKRRFPEDFVFQLSREEAVELADNLKSQSVISSWGGARRALPFAFTEHGALMAANVLRSDRAVAVSVFIVRAFVRLRETLSAHRELAGKLNELDRKLQHHDQDIRTLIAAVRQLMTEPEPKSKPRIGYQTEAGRGQGQ